MNKKLSYQELRAKLDGILQELESDNLDIDEAMVLHKQGQEVIAQMEKYLDEVGRAVKKTSKNK